MNVALKLNSLFEKKYFNLVFFAILLIIPLLLYGNLYHDDQIFMSGDGVSFFMTRAQLREAFEVGEIPLWSKYLGNGIPLTDVSFGIFYPPIWLIAILPIKPAIYLYYSLHLATGAMFTYLFLMEINVKPPIALVMAFIYEMSVGLGGLRKDHIMIIAAVIYIPIILFSLSRFFFRKKYHYLFFASFAMSLQVASFVQIAFYTDIFAFFYFVYLSIRCRSTWRTSVIHMLQWIGTYIGLICIYLFPTAEMLMFYSQGGALPSQIEYFKSYSIHFIKLAQMIFPEIWGDIYGSFTAWYSSGIDIEIYWGTGIFLLALFGIRYYRKDKDVLFFLMTTLLSFSLAAHAHIPYLSEILYKIPILGSFRVSARVLPIFNFSILVIASITLSKTVDVEYDRKKFSSFCFFVSAACTGLLLAVGTSCLVPFVINKEISETSISLFKEYVEKAYFLPCLSLWLYTGIFAACVKKGNVINSQLKATHLLAMLLLLITIVQTIPYTLQTSPAPISLFASDDIDTIRIVDDIENYKAFDAIVSMGHLQNKVISGNRNAHVRIPTLNAYIAFNNPMLYRLLSENQGISYNASGALIGFPSTEKLLSENSILSMLGVKYIFDTDRVLTDALLPPIDFSTANTKTILNINDAILDGSDQLPSVLEYSFLIEPKTYYKIDISYFVTDPSDTSVLYIDFYGEAYDFTEQDVALSTTTGNHTDTYFIYSGVTPKDAFLRLVSLNMPTVLVRSLQCDKLDNAEQQQLYVPLFTQEDGTVVYENNYVRDILYAPSKVIDIDAKYEMDIGHEVIDYANIAYVENYPETLDLSNVEVSFENVDFLFNTINADVTTSESAFIIFSQNYFPGWRAYINDKRVPLYMVNGLIQGIEVPSGAFTLKFQFVPISLYLGIVVGILTLSVSLAMILSKRKTVR